MADISFSQRLGHIMDITSALSVAGQDLSESQAQARTIEGEIFAQAADVDAYQRQVGRILAHLQPSSNANSSLLQVGRILAHLQPSSNANSSLLQVSADPDEILNPEGPTIGPYEHATFYQDGQTSTVFKARAKDPEAKERIVALKVTHPSQMTEPHNSVREARLLGACSHPNVVPLLETLAESGGRFVLVFPFLRQDLENLLRTDTLTRQQAEQVFVGLFEALAYIHGLGLIHRDVKPSNILLRSMDGPVYLADFGIAWSPNDKDSEGVNDKITDVGTTRYRPPELLFGCRSYDTSLDIWAAGCVVAELVRTGHLPLFDSGPLGSDLTLIKSIFTTLGTPDDSVWPSAASYPDWTKITFQKFPGKRWDEVLPGADDSAIDFVASTVCFEKMDHMHNHHRHLHRELAKRKPEDVTQEGTVYSIVYVTASPTFTGIIGGYTTLTEESSSQETEASADSSSSAQVLTAPVVVSTTAASSYAVETSADVSSVDQSSAATAIFSSVESSAAEASASTAVQLTAPASTWQTYSTATTAALDSASSAADGAGTAIGVIAAVGLLAVFLLWFLGKKRRQREADERANNEKAAFDLGRHASPIIQPPPPAANDAPRLSLRPMSRMMDGFLGANNRRSAQMLSSIGEDGRGAGNAQGFSPAQASTPTAQLQEKQPLENPFADPQNPFQDPVVAPGQALTDAPGSVPIAVPVATQLPENKLNASSSVATTQSKAREVDASSSPIQVQPTTTPAVLESTVAKTLAAAGVATAAGAAVAAHNRSSVTRSPSPEDPLPIQKPASPQSSQENDSLPSSPAAAASALSSPALSGNSDAPPGGNVFRVLMDFSPSMDDELELKTCQLIRLLHEYDDGWWEIAKAIGVSYQESIDVYDIYQHEAAWKQPFCAADNRCRPPSLNHHCYHFFYGTGPLASRLQDELLQLTLVHSRSHAQLEQYSSSARSKLEARAARLKREEGDVCALEAKRQEGVNLLGLFNWVGKDGGPYSASEQVRNLSFAIQQLATLTQPGGDFTRFVEDQGVELDAGWDQTVEALKTRVRFCQTAFSQVRREAVNQDKTNETNEMNVSNNSAIWNVVSGHTQLANAVMDQLVLCARLRSSILSRQKALISDAIGQKEKYHADASQSNDPRLSPPPLLAHPRDFMRPTSPHRETADSRAQADRAPFAVTTPSEAVPDRPEKRMRLEGRGDHDEAESRTLGAAPPAYDNEWLRHIRTSEFTEHDIRGSCSNCHGTDDLLGSIVQSLIDLQSELSRLMPSELSQKAAEVHPRAVTMQGLKHSLHWTVQELRTSIRALQGTLVTTRAGLPSLADVVSREDTGHSLAPILATPKHEQQQLNIGEPNHPHALSDPGLPPMFPPDESRRHQSHEHSSLGSINSPRASSGSSALVPASHSPGHSQYPHYRSLPSPASQYSTLPVSGPVQFSSSPSPAVQASHLQDLQHQISTKTLALQTLQKEHDQLLAAFSRSQIRCNTLDKKSQVSDHEINVLTEEKIRLQQQVESLEGQVEDLQKSRDDVHKQSSADGAQWRQIMAMSSQLQIKSAEEAKRFKLEREDWERERTSLKLQIQDLELGRQTTLSVAVGPDSGTSEAAVGSMSGESLGQELVKLRASCAELELIFQELSPETELLDKAIGAMYSVKQKLSRSSLSHSRRHDAG
ncbi:hypothetical protein DV735_g5361, partial [Chaetothyriales sp. CBS 134920]